MILNVHNLDSLQPLIMVMGLGADTSLKAIMCQTHLSALPAFQLYREQRELFPWEPSKLEETHMF